MRVARLLFARIPERGKVKSRLAADLDDSAAFEIYRWLLRVQARVFDAVPDNSNTFTNYVYYAPKVSRLQARFRFSPDLKGLHLRFRPQCEGDLGARLTNACADVLKQNDLVLIWGADIPCLPHRIEAQAIALFPQSVITLARDGGYAFLSLSAKNFSSAVFERIRWSTVHAGKDQLQALISAGLKPVVRGKVADLDRAKDFTRIVRELEQYGRAADLADFARTCRTLTVTPESHPHSSPGIEQ